MALELLKDHAATLVRRCNSVIVPQYRSVALRRYQLLAVGWNKGRGANTIEELMEYRQLQQRNYEEACATKNELWACQRRCDEFNAQVDDIHNEITETLSCIHDLSGTWHSTSMLWDFEKEYCCGIDINGPL